MSTFCVRIYDIIRDISRQKVSWSGQAGSGGAGSTLEMDSGHRNKKNVFSLNLYDHFKEFMLLVQGKYQATTL